MALEKDIELLDDYLANRMPAGERASFEKKIEAEPELRSELRLQQQLIESVKKARAAELKAMLNNIPVSTIGSSSSSVITKVAVWTTVAVIIGTGLYFVLSKEEIKKTQPTNAIKDEKPTQPVAPSSEIIPPAPVVEDKKEVVRPTPHKQKKAAKKETTADPKIEVFDPSTEVEETTNEPEEVLLNNTSVPYSTIIVEIDDKSRKFDFHYKLENDQLTLFGPFEKNLYEILEFITEEKRTAFLFYKQNYYYIKDTDKPVALAPVKDPVLLKKLREHRARN